MQRVLRSLATLIAVSLLAFSFVRSLNVQVTIVLGRHELFRQIHMPFWTGYFSWLMSTVNGQGTLSLVNTLMPPTFELLGIGVLICLGVTVVLGVWQVRHAGSVADRVVTWVAYGLYSVPPFWLAVLLIYFFAFELLWLPGNGPWAGTQGFQNWGIAMVLPVATLALTTIGGWTRFLRAELEDAMGQDYIRTARGKGVSEGLVVARHALRNSLISLVSLAGMSLPGLFNVIIVIEWIFHMPGLGSGLIGAFLGLNYAGAVDIALVIALTTTIGSLIADLLYAYINPRVRFM